MSFAARFPSVILVSSIYTKKIISPQMSSQRAYVFRFEQEDMYRHLCLEECLLNILKENQTFLYIWQCNNSVIIGKNQNPWVECSLPYTKENQINLGRRLSGGGTVYQDLGNVNYSFLTSRKNFNQDDHFQIILSALKTLGISASLDKRNALFVKGKKFSGNAFFYRKEKVLHHGTILVNANLSRMDKCLRSTIGPVYSKAIQSVRSDVINLAEINSNLDCEKVSQAIIAEFGNSFSKKFHFFEDDSLVDPIEMRILYKKYCSWNWIFGRTPKFNISLPISIGSVHGELKIHILNGEISEIETTKGELKRSDEKTLRDNLIGNSFSKEAILSGLEPLDQFFQIPKNASGILNEIQKRVY